MFYFKICTIEQAPDLHDSWATRTLSLIDKVSIYRHFPLGRNNKVIFFDDHEDAAHEDAPTLSDVREALDWTADLKAGDRFLCHCHAGVSRSVALVIAVLVQHGVDPKVAMVRVAAARPEIWPNGLIATYADDVLETGGTISRAIHDWKTEQQHLALQSAAEAELAETIGKPA